MAADSTGKQSWIAANGGVATVLLALIAMSGVFYNAFEQLAARMDRLEIGQREMQSDLHAVRTDMREVQVEIGVLQSDVRQLQSDVRDLQSDVRDLNLRVGRIEGRLGLMGAAEAEDNAEEETP